MDHLTESEIFEYVDRRMSPGAEREAGAHCAVCAQCRQSVELQRALARSASEPMAGMLADNFAERVMRRTRSAERASRFSWLLQNSSNIIAMAFVLAVLGAIAYIAAQMPDASEGGGMVTTTFTSIASLWKDASASVNALFAQRAADAVTPMVSQTEKVFGNVFWIGAAAFLLLGLADRIRVRFKMPTMLSR